MSAVKDTYIALRSATEGSRDLDIMIAELIGWERRTLRITDTATGSVRERPQWMKPGTHEPTKVPLYTSDLDDTMILAESVADGDRIAFSWEADEAHATVSRSGRISKAPTLELAICVASVLAIAAQEVEKDQSEST
ncbi:hypothetical protein JNB91_23725 [Rhizobium wenxiniae]|uniref:hypothetical protein n=1 Tax=Rhizobium wenxiniae TaxID=1737357 RepID=UPI001C6E2A34|nr:hypothetical protein [Rhizobium wenxiniae]MBW9090825.1 hypothetical protein [Rhizobium wenxiniae]